MFRSISLIPRKVVHDLNLVKQFSGFIKFLALKKKEAKRAQPKVSLLPLRLESSKLWSEMPKAQKRNTSFKNFYKRQRRAHLATIPGIDFKAVREAARKEWDSMPDVKKKKYGFVIKTKPKVSKRMRREASGREKRPVNGFILFANEIRKDVMAAKPGAKVLEIGPIIGQKWKSLSDAQKQVYRDASKAPLEVFKAETARLKSLKVKRPVTGFIKFAQEKRPQLLAQRPELKSKVVEQGRALGSLWRLLDEATKAQYLKKN